MNILVLLFVLLFFAVFAYSSQDIKLLAKVKQPAEKESYDKKKKLPNDDPVDRQKEPPEEEGISRKEVIPPEILEKPQKKPPESEPLAQPPSKRGNICIRITSIPLSWDKKQLQSFIQKLDPQLNVGNYEVSIFPACSSLNTQTAILSLSIKLGYFKGQHKHVPIDTDQDERPKYLMFDQQFNGMTPLNRPDGHIKADVVAVTGLAGHAWGSWVNRETRAMWLHDFLPKEIKNIRVMTYGYDSRFGGGSGNLDLTDYRNEFIRALKDCRNECEDRPLILIAHSLGGILVLQALIDSNYNYLHMNIKSATKGIFLFAVPHQGLDQAGWDELLDHEIELQDRNSNETMKKLVQQLEQGSEFLRIQKEQLMHLWTDFKGSIFSFYETKKTAQPKKGQDGLGQDGKFTRGGPMIKMVTQLSAQLYHPLESRIPVHNADHTDIVKFDSETNRTFITVVKEVSNCIQEKHSLDTKTKQSLFGHVGEPAFLLQLLSTIDQDSVLADEHDSLVQSDPAISWIFKDIGFKNWQSSEDSHILWISGPAKCKIHLASALVKSAARHSNPLVLSCFFSADPRLNPMVDAAHTLLRQIIEAFADIKDRASFVKGFLENFEKSLDLHSNPDGNLPTAEQVLLDKKNVEKLLDCLAKSLSVFHKMELLFIIDGIFFDRFHTSEPSDEKILLDFFQKVSENVCMIKILITSNRPYASPTLENTGIHFGSIDYDKERIECLKTLSTGSVGSLNQPDLRRSDNTLEWFWNLPGCHSWLTSDNSQVLFFEGKPGSGKSTLACYLHQEISQKLHARGKSPIILGFRNGNRTIHNLYHTILGAFLYTILEKDKSLFVCSTFQEKYRQLRSQLRVIPSRQDMIVWPENMLHDIFISCITNIGQTETIYLILDLTINHSEQHDGGKIAQLLQNICAVKHSCVKIFLTSRPNADFTFRKIWLQDVNSANIKQLVKMEITDPQENISRIAKYIVDNSQGIFLWVGLVTNKVKVQIKKGQDTGTIFQTLESLPKDIEDFYNQMFKELEATWDDNRDLNIGRKMFEFALFSKRPLTIHELGHAVTVPGISEDGADLEGFPTATWLMDNEITNIEQRLTHCAGTFLEPYYIDDTQLVRFLHGTAREFFMQPCGVVSKSGLTINEQEVDESIAIACVQYIRIFCSQSNLNGDWSEKNIESFVKNLEKMHFMQYILQFLPEHLESLGQLPILDHLYNLSKENPAYIVLETLVGRLRRLRPYTLTGHHSLGGRFPGTRARVRRPSEPRQTQSNRPQFDLRIDLVAGPSVQGSLSQPPELNPPALEASLPHRIRRTSSADKAPNRNSNSAYLKRILEYAIKTEAINTISILLEGSPVARVIAMETAVENKKTRIIQLLFRDAVAARIPFCEIATPGLLRAAEYAHEDFARIARILLEKDAQPNAIDEAEGSDCSSVLSKASKVGNIDMVELLLGYDVDINARDKYDRTALDEAASAGHESIVEKLLKKNAYVEGCRLNQTPLLTAISRRYHGVVDVLLSGHANVKVKDANQRSALTIALLEHEDLDIANSLLDHHADVDEKDTDQTILMRAVSDRKYRVAKFLLEKGANVNKTDNNLITSLMKAIQNVHVEMVELLIENGADVHAFDVQLQTTLIMAVSTGNLEVVEILLRKKVDPKAKDRNQKTALMRTSAENRQLMLDLLLKHIAPKVMEDVAPIDQCSSELIKACRAANFSMAKLLIDFGVDVNETNADGMTALMSPGNYKIAQLLLNNGANVNAHDTDGQSILIHAISTKLEDVVELLIKRGADVSGRDKSDTSALFRACSEGQDKITQILLKYRATVIDKVYIKGCLRAAAKGNHEAGKNTSGVRDPNRYWRDGKVFAILCSKREYSNLSITFKSWG